MDLTDEEVNLIKIKSKNYLIKSIYKLSSLLMVDPEKAINASNLNDLFKDRKFSSAEKDFVLSLNNQIICLKKLG